MGFAQDAVFSFIIMDFWLILDIGGIKKESGIKKNGRASSSSATTAISFELDRSPASGSAGDCSAMLIHRASGRRTRHKKTAKAGAWARASGTSIQKSTRAIPETAPSVKTFLKKRRAKYTAIILSGIGESGTATVIAERQRAATY